jgi:hypothetical protein
MPLILKSQSHDVLNSDDIELDLIGDLGHEVCLPRVHPRLSQRLVFDFGHLKRLSSSVTVQLATWWRQFDSRQQFVFRRLQPAFLNIVNQVDGFMPKETIVESVFVPYECENCESEELFLAERGVHYVEAIGDKPESVMLPHAINCNKCDGRSKISVFQSQYWKFLNPTSSN